MWWDAGKEGVERGVGVTILRNGGGFFFLDWGEGWSGKLCVDWRSGEAGELVYGGRWEVGRRKAAGERGGVELHCVL